jgi:hypothetical protein
MSFFFSGLPNLLTGGSLSLLSNFAGKIGCLIWPWLFIRIYIIALRARSLIDLRPQYLYFLLKNYYELGPCPSCSLRSSKPLGNLAWLFLSLLSNRLKNDACLFCFWLSMRLYIIALLAHSLINGRLRCLDCLLKYNRAGSMFLSLRLQSLQVTTVCFSLPKTDKQRIHVCSLFGLIWGSISSRCERFLSSSSYLQKLMDNDACFFSFSALKNRIASLYVCSALHSL